MFCDELKIKLKAGKGGDGCVSFRREKFVPKGGPDGGDGGKGGSIIFLANRNLNTLGHLTNGKKYEAESGESGKKKNMHGKNGENLIIEVPEGTIIFKENKTKQIADLKNDGEIVTIARGGKGGLGNARFKSSIHQVPRFAENGEPGEEKEVTLELKLVADVGIIGLPSAGKSTLISVISNARPKIADYHFTTLIPNLGVVNLNDTTSFVVADIPGLIEGASKGKGLGHRFLRHIARTKILVHILDGSLEKPLTNLKTINSELKKFDKTLVEKEQIIVINKIDIIPQKNLKKIAEKLARSLKVEKIFQISGVTNEGIKELLYEIANKLKSVKQKERKERINTEKTPTIIKPIIRAEKFKIEKIIRKKDKKIFRIVGEKIEQISIMTDIKNPEGLERMYRQMQKLGINKAVEKNGATFGDIIKIKDKNIPYRK